MPDLLEIAEKLQDTHEAVVRLEQSIAERGVPPPSIVSMLNSLRMRQESLEAQFAEATAVQHLDVCRYELFPQTKERPTLAAFTKTLLDFQSLFTQVYEALAKGTPRGTARISLETTVETAFTFAYTFSGSLGVVLTMPNERLLLGESALDQAMNKVFELIKAGTSAKIASHAREVGVAPIRTMYKWVSDQVFSGLSSRIEWRRKQEIRSKLQIQRPELEELKRAIESTSDEDVKEITKRGQLVGADIQTRSFHMIFAEDQEIRGKMAEGIAAKHTVELPRVYTATIRTTTTISYATEKESVVHYLLSLED